MRCLLMFVAAVVVTSGFAVGEEPGEVSEHIRAYRPMFGSWFYEGPVLEDIPGVAEKGDRCIVRLSFRPILDKAVVMEDSSVEFGEGKKMLNKALIGWNAADRQIIHGGMNSMGGMGLGTVEFDKEAKTCTLTVETADSEGQKASMKTVVTKAGKDTITFQVLESTGENTEWPGPVYTLKRVKPTKRSGVARDAKPNENLKGYRPLIGTWRYEGPVLEESPLVKKGTKVVVDFSWRWILDKQVVMADWVAELEDGVTMSGKSLLGWNAADKKIMGGGMTSIGGTGIATVVIDGRTVTSTHEGVKADGRKTSSKNMVKITDKETLTWQALERTGGDMEGPSPVYTYKKVKRTKGKKAAK